VNRTLAVLDDKSPTSAAEPAKPIDQELNVLVLQALGDEVIRRPS
jgi:hypothetical protein